MKKIEAAADPPSDKNAPKTRGRPFSKGNSGRPRGSRNKVPKSVKAHIAEQLPAIADALIEKALKGNVQAATTLLRTVVPQAREEGEPVKLDLPKIETAADAAAAISKVLEAVSNGELSPDVAERIVAIAERHARVLETADLERRLAIIERQQQEARK